MTGERIKPRAILGKEVSVGFSAAIQKMATRAFSMSRSLVSSFGLCLFLHGAFAFVVGCVAPHVAHHRVSIRTLCELA
jgi:hypothetical protein